MDWGTSKKSRIDLDEDVPRRALKECLDSGWTAQDIALEFDITERDVILWCNYHELPRPVGQGSSKVEAEAPAVQPKPAATAPAAKERAPKRQAKGDAFDARIKALHAQGKTYAEIRDETALCYGTIRASLYRQGLTPHVAKSARQRASEVLHKSIIALHEQGKPAPDIALLVGIAPSSVYRHLRNAGLTPNEPPGAALRPAFLTQQRDAALEKVATMHADGLSVHEIAQAMMRSTATVVRYHRALGLEPHKRTPEVKDRQRVTRLARELVRSMHGEGLTLKQMSARTGRSITDLRADMAAMGLKPPADQRRDRHEALLKAAVEAMLALDATDHEVSRLVRASRSKWKEVVGAPTREF